jgi:hypothetical protein
MSGLWSVMFFQVPVLLMLMMIMIYVDDHGPAAGWIWGNGVGALYIASRESPLTISHHGFMAVDC